MIKDILKGIIIGVANIIPGVSGGTLAVTMGIYSKIITSITNIFKDFKKSIKTLMPYGIGMLIGIVVFSFIITFFFEKAPIPTNFLFIGLILGGVPLIYSNIKGNKITWFHIALFILFAALVIIMGLTKATDTNTQITLSFVEIIKLFFIGIVAAATMVIPGVSGSMMLTLLGYYQPVTLAIKNLVKALSSFNMDVILNSLGILIPFLVGALLGIIVIAKLIEVLLKKCPSYVFSAILGLIVASPIAILSNLSFATVEIPHLMLSVITLAVGIIISLKLGKE